MTSQAALRELEMAVYREPESDEPRRAYAAALRSAGDVRGEFIDIQLAPKPTKAQRVREKELLRENKNDWLGPLEPLLYKSDLSFCRGFVSEAHAQLSKSSEVEAAQKLPHWSTIEALELVGTGRHADEVGRLLNMPAFRGLKKLGRVPGAVVPYVVAGEEPRALASIDLWGHYDSTGEAEYAQAFAERFATSPSASKLTEISIRYSSSPDAWEDSWSQAAMSLGPRLRRLQIAPDSQSMAHESWVRGSIEREIPTPYQHFTCFKGYQHRSGWRYTLERDASGSYTLTCEYRHRKGKGDHFGRLAEMLQQLEGKPIAKLTVKAPRYTPAKRDVLTLRRATLKLPLSATPTLPEGKDDA